MKSVGDTLESGSWPPPSTAQRRVLLVTYTFPPVGGAGVQRVAKFAKFLPRCGWNVTVLTAANPSVPLFDQSLLADVGHRTEVVRATTWEPGYAIKATLAGAKTTVGYAVHWSPQAWLKAGLRRAVSFALQPDPQILWKRNAVRKGMRRLREKPHDAILATAPPFSTLLIGKELSRRSGLPLIVDYRDEWGISNQYWENKRLDPVSRSIQTRMQRSVLRSADAVVATTQASASTLREECAAVQSRATVECVYNGFDLDDFEGTSGAVPNSTSDGIVRLAYVGTLWTLTTIEPIVRALTRLAHSSSAMLSRFRLVVAGRRTPVEQNLLDQLKPYGPLVEEHEYLDHVQAIALMSSADQLCVTLADVPGAERVLPAKIFEYAAIGRPILAVAPKGELWSILEKFPQSRAFEPGDDAGIACYLESLAQPLQNDQTQWTGSDGCAEFERSYQTRRLAGILESALRRVT